VQKTFTDCSLLPCQRTPRPKFSRRKLRKRHKTVKFMKGFSLKSFPLYSITTLDIKYCNIMLYQNNICTCRHKHARSFALLTQVQFIHGNLTPKKLFFSGRIPRSPLFWSVNFERPGVSVKSSTNQNHNNQ